jgi:sugar lactone lactonase YvrE
MAVYTNYNITCGKNSRNMKKLNKGRTSMRTAHSIRSLSAFRVDLAALLVSFVAAVAAPQHVNSQTISTLAGATPLFNEPSAVALDTAGNINAPNTFIYVADTFSHRVYRINSAGSAAVIAGTGVAGSTGDGGLATAAQVSVPAGLAVDAAGNLYVAENLGNRVRKITPAGIISTVAGTGVAGFSGDDGPATAAKLNGPWGLAVDATGNLFIADSDNHRVRRVDTAGVMTTIAGYGFEGYNGDGNFAIFSGLAHPLGVAVDGTGNVWIADTRNDRIRRVSTGGIISTVAGTGVRGFSGDGALALAAQLSLPASIKLDASGNAYVTDSGNYRVRKFADGGSINTVAGNGVYGFSGDGGPPTSAALAFPYDAAVDASGNLYIADTDNNRIRKVTGLTARVARDLNGDAKSDILYFDATGAAGVVLMNGVTQTGSGNVLTAGSGWSITHAADFDGDGKADLLIKNTNGQIAILLMNGETVKSAALLVGTGGDYTPVLTGDFNGDGKADIVLKKADGLVALLLMNGTAVSSAGLLLSAGSPWSVTHTGDFDGDGKSDLVLKNTDGSAALLLMNGTAVAAANYVLEAGSPWTVTHAADMDGDRRTDLVIRNVNGEYVQILMNGTSVVNAAYILFSPYTITHLADFNGDGKADLVIRHPDRSAALLIMNGVGGVTSASYLLLAGSTSIVAQVADYNGDGKSDILLKNADGSATVILKDGGLDLGRAAVWGAGTRQVVP